MSTSKIGGFKPKKSSLISNLLNRVDEKSLAVKKSKDNGILIYWISDKEKHLKVNKEVLNLLSENELYQVLDGDELAKDFSLSMFDFKTHIPKINEPIIEKSVVVRSYKEIDKIGTSKGQQEIFDKKKNSTKIVEVQKNKRPRIITKE